MTSTFKRFALLCALGLGTLLPASAGSIYTLRFHNVDDGMFGYITNSTFTGQQVLSIGCCGGDTGDVDITSFTTDGLNTLEIQDFNNHGGGYAYAWELKQDGVILASDSCGTFGIVGCNGNSSQTGLVYDTTTSFAAGVPEPATFWLFGMSAAGLIARRRLGRR